jgi:molybdopterin-guanine dinucleotide biosynthesis protein B
MNPVIIGIYGKSNIGKTTLIVNIINQLSDEGFKVATVKITDKKIGMDVEEKDTYRYKKAGSELAVFSSPIETDFLHIKKIETNKIYEHIEKFGKYDIILVEGARDKNIPKIRLGDIKKRQNTIYTYCGDINEVFKIIKKIINKR